MRVFVNQVDTYVSGAVSKLFSTTIPGSHRSLRQRDDDHDEYDGQHESQSEANGPSHNKERELERYEVWGTLQDPLATRPAWVRRIVRVASMDDLLAAVLECDVVVFNVESDSHECVAATAVIEAIELALTAGQRARPTTFVCLSSVMTWARTKPADVDNPATPLLEEEYRRRRAHPNFKEAQQVEKMTVKLGKTAKGALHVAVIATGIVYGGGEGPLHFLFRQAWEHGGERGAAGALPIFGDGLNQLAMIHVHDLARVVVYESEGARVGTDSEKQRYVVAIDNGQVTLGELVRFVSERLAGGRVRTCPATVDSLVHVPELTQSSYDKLVTSINIEPALVQDYEFEWVAQEGILEYGGACIGEYRRARGLGAVRVVVHGPPGVGKTRLTERICKHYKVERVNVASVVAEAVARLERSEAKLKRAQAGKRVALDDDVDKDGDDDSGDGDGDDAFAGDREERVGEEEGETAAAAGALAREPDAEYEEALAELMPVWQQDTEYLAELREMAQEHNGRYPDEHVVQFVRDKLLSRRCRNRGYVLDGFPRTYAQAQELFRRPENEEEEEEDEDDGERDTEEHDDDDEESREYDRRLMPEQVFALQADDCFLRERIINLPESLVAGTHNTEEGHRRRLAVFRAHNTDDSTVLNYFDELEVHPVELKVAHDDDEDVCVWPAVLRALGKPRNYGLTDEEKAAKAKAEQQQMEARERVEQEERVRKETMRAREQERAQADWTKRVETVRRDEAVLLEAQSMPLRHYLMQHVMPTLTKGLVQISKTRPDDPVDALAEFLLRDNVRNQ